jgi:hypothetical protein
MAREEGSAALAEIERLQAAKKTDKSKPQQASSTDPEARFMRTGDGGLAPAYNVQLAADEEHGFIVDVETVDDPQDASQLPSAMERIKTSLGRYPEQALADGGYTNHPTVVAMAERAIDFYGVMSGRSDAPLGAAGGSDPAIAWIASVMTKRPMRWSAPKASGCAITVNIACPADAIFSPGRRAARTAATARRARNAVPN